MRNNINFNFKYPKKIFIVFLFIMFILYGRLLFLAASPVIDGLNMDEFAKARNTENKKLYATRGTIYDKDENILAMNVSSYTVIAYINPIRTTDSSKPQHVVDKKKTASLLSPILNMTEERLLELLESKGYQVELGPGGRDITELKKDEILSLNLPGIGFISKYKRNYPNGDFASYVVGYAKLYEEVVKEDGLDKINYNIVGELGIESKYNDLLKGTDGSLIFQRDRFGYKIPDTKETKIPAINGSDIYLTLDSSIQRFLEAEVKKTSIEYEPEWLQVTVMDAKTGAILGTSSTPSYNPNLLNITNYENPLTSYLFEPGSTMKTYTYMCAIDKGNYNGDEYYDSGSIKIGNDIVSDWNDIGWGRITLDKGYEYSSNTGIYNVINKYLDKKELLDCFKKYGFGSKTDIELPRELAGDLNFNYEIEVTTAGFGQGITTTAIQHLQALSIIANNGNMVKPYVVEKIIDPNTGRTAYNHQANVMENIVKESTVNKMKELMYNVIYGTDSGTTGTAYKIDGFDILGKTGTAEIYDNKTGRYLTGWNDYIYSFSGIYPKDDPEIIIYAAMKKPSRDRSAGLSVATKNIMKNIAKYLNMFDESSEVKEISSYKVPSFISKNVDTVKAELENKGITPIILGNGNKVIKQYPSANEDILITDKVFLLTNGSELLMPNIMSWSKIDVMNMNKLINLETKFDGYGYVNKQSIKFNEVINKDAILEVELKIKEEEKL